MKEVVFSSDMVRELGLQACSDSIPVYIDNASSLHVARNPTYSSHGKYVALRYSLHPGIVQGRKNQRPSRQKQGPTCQKGHESSEQTQAQLPRQGDR
ncbi:unnamed protein product [Sphacelaria rigidula]